MREGKGRREHGRHVIEAEYDYNGTQTGNQYGLCVLCVKKKNTKPGNKPLMAIVLIEMLMRESEESNVEIYREASYNRRYKVVYFTELNEHNKESEINRAMAGDHFFDGFLNGAHKDEAKVIDRDVSSTKQRREA